MENVQPHLLTSGDLVPVCLRRADVYGNGKDTSCFQGLFNEENSIKRGCGSPTRSHLFPFPPSSVCLHTLWGSSPWETGGSNRNGCQSCCRCCYFTTVKAPVRPDPRLFKGLLSDRAPTHFFCWLLLSVLVFSDPFFPLSFLVNSWFPGTLDAFFQALFLSSLLLFWLCVYHGIRVQVASPLFFFSL